MEYREEEFIPRSLTAGQSLLLLLILTAAAFCWHTWFPGLIVAVASVGLAAAADLVAAGAAPAAAFAVEAEVVASAAPVAVVVAPAVVSAAAVALAVLVEALVVAVLAAALAAVFVVAGAEVAACFCPAASSRPVAANKPETRYLRAIA